LQKNGFQKIYNTQENMKISYISLGCSKNRVDLEYLMGSLKEGGHEITLEMADADAIIINTCGFIEPAVNEAVEAVLEAAQVKKPDAKLIVTGCMTERFKKDVSGELPEIDFHTGVGKMSDVIAYLEGLEPTGKEERDFLYGGARVLTTVPFSAYIKISEGCNNRCTYCTIPSIRGNLESRTIESVTDEIKSLAEQGVMEFVIVSQDNTKYGRDIYGKDSICKLLKEIEKIDGKFVVRLMYLNPDGVTEELVKLIKNSKKILSYYDIPIQHINSRVLKDMHRKAKTEDIKRVFSTIREIDPDAFIRTTMIVGFPGETDEEFAELLEFVQEYKPDYAGFFPFYPEEGTQATAMGMRVDGRKIRGRIGKLRKAQMKNTCERLKKLKKNDIICFAEKPNEEFGFLIEGRAIFQAPEVDGKVLFTDSEAIEGFGPYVCRIDQIKYPDIVCEVIRPADNF
jgi:ribosomal protein S12 methylthiotransferase